jgi:hypothetical protein
MPQLAGSAISWQNNTLHGTTAFAAELPAWATDPRIGRPVHARRARGRTHAASRSPRAGVGEGYLWSGCNLSSPALLATGGCLKEPKPQSSDRFSAAVQAAQGGRRCDLQVLRGQSGPPHRIGAANDKIQRQISVNRGNATCRFAGISRNGSDGTRTRDLRRDRPGTASGACPGQSGLSVISTRYLGCEIPG